MERLEHFFRLKDHKTTVSTEIAAGFTTFITMSYIILVNPELIASGVAAAGGPSDAVFNGVLIATCLASFIGTILMALYAKLPLAQAPGMGINAFFAFSVIVGFGMTYQEALAIVFISGVLFILITACGLRELIIRCIPTSVQEALPVGIGMFIAFVGMQNAGLVVHNDSTLIAFADFSAISDPDQKVAVYDYLFSGFVYRRVRQFICGSESAFYNFYYFNSGAVLFPCRYVRHPGSSDQRFQKGGLQRC